MAVSWIKMRDDLHESPEVGRIAEVTGLDVFGVTGRLLRLWGWAGRETVTGLLRNVTPVTLDRIVACEKFFDALVTVGWAERYAVTGSVTPGETWVRLLKWNKYNANSERERSKNAARQAKYREKKRKKVTRDTPVTDRYVTVTSNGSNASRGEEIRGEEIRKKKEKKEPARGGEKIPGHGTPIPDTLNTPEFIQAWTDWSDYKQQRKEPLLEISWKKEMGRLERAGAQTATEAINLAIAKNWQGIQLDAVKPLETPQKPSKVATLLDLENYSPHD